MKNSLYLKATRCEKTSRPPIWMMRQAGRYLPGYRKLRENVDFMDICRTTDLATQVTLEPIHRFGMDAAILFCDILVTAEAMGGDLNFVKNMGPVFSHPIRNQADIDRLNVAGVADSLDYVYQNIKSVKKELETQKIPLIGFAGAPFTVASYLVEGRGSKDLKQFKKLLFNEPEQAHQLLEKISIVTIDYLNRQIEAGVDSLQIFDSWANHLAWDDFISYSQTYITRIIKALDNPKQIPITVFCRGSSYFAPVLQETGAQVLSVDWNADLLAMRKTIDPKIALQGNLDPYLLYAKHDILEKRVKKLLDKMAPYPGYIFNLGHGILPDIDVETVQFVVDIVQNYENN